MPASPAARRRALAARIARRELVVAPGAHDGLFARMVEAAGFGCVYMTGSGVANGLLGKPDVGLLTLTEMAMMARFVTQAVSVPVISDADAGYGNALNVIRAVEEFEAAGVSAIHLEDQAQPKRCGSIAGKELVSAEEMAGKIRAAVEARSDPNFLIIARTDARAVTGFDDAVARARAYRAAGADLTFPEALLSEDEYRVFAECVPGPKLFNMGGYARTRTTPRLGFDYVAGLGYAIVILPLAAVRPAVRAAADFLADLAMRGVEAEVEATAALAGHPVENWYEFTGISHVRALEQRYLPAGSVERRYAASLGHRPGEGNAGTAASRVGQDRAKGTE